uniref:TMV resistance protein N-like n=1 Tax=Fragaria vesca subsp. vesca TaxID=101020 RepID=UPI0005CB0A45|nr:PREDICTED: TMV resistance protein N-like [Fragaria vesca subsp. vesca]
MDSHLNEMLSYLDFGCPDVRIIGIWGMGGVGKTTIAQVVSERVKAQFEGDSFLENVREVTEKQGVVHLQQQLLSNLLKSTEHVQTSKMGKDIIRHRLCDRKVLLILDDVDQDEQLQALCGRTWFGPGSRVIVTSRDEHLLSAFGVDGVYKVKPLTDPEALQLFHMKAFKKDQLVGEDFLKLSKEFLKYYKGLPLAIKVLGSSVNGRSEKLWSSELKRLKKSPNMKIISVLKFSYDGLQETKKKLFLDLACFFKGEDMDRVKRILQGSNDDSLDLDLEVLLEKSMVILFGKKLWMHDLIQELGWELVHQECCQDPGQRSRLGLSNEILHVFDRNKVRNCTCKAETKLRLLRIWNVKFSGDIKYLSNELQFLDWHECPPVSGLA